VTKRCRSHRTPKRVNTMRLFQFLFFTILLVASFQVTTAQDPVARAEKAFESANEKMEQRKFAEALKLYQEALKGLPNEPTVYFNGGMAAYQAKDFVEATKMWKRTKELDPLDWHARAKLVQAYQAQQKLPERDAERTELFELWKSGKSEELKAEIHYCRDQFEVKGKKVMVFEHFELKGDRALRYVFSVLNKKEDDEEWRISLGSYNLTNSVWRMNKQPPPKEGERLFHLDGYWPTGSHATYGMYFPEPTYDETRSRVIQILEKGDKL
jgi:tetratricopeptide (TPR) repeat protein